LGGFPNIPGMKIHISQLNLQREEGRTGGGQEGEGKGEGRRVGD